MLDYLYRLFNPPLFSIWPQCDHRWVTRSNGPGHSYQYCVKCGVTR